MKDKIKVAMKISAHKLRESKRALGQQVVVSEAGKIKVVYP